MTGCQVSSGTPPERIGTDCSRLYVCPECRRLFEPYKRAHGRQVFCSPACRKKAWERERRPEKPSREERILARLFEGPATALELQRAGGGQRVGARVNRLRSWGHRILGPRRWKRPETLGGGVEEETVPATEGGHALYVLKAEVPS